MLMLSLSFPSNSWAQSLKSNDYTLDIDWEESSTPTTIDSSSKPTGLMPTKGYILEQRTHKDDNRLLGIGISTPTTQDNAAIVTIQAKETGATLTVRSVAQSVGKYGILQATRCDSGNCTYTQAGKWTRDEVAGFGYSVEGNSIPADFRSLAYFRPLANPHNSEKPAVIVNRFLSNETDLRILFKDTTEEKSIRQGVELTVLPWY